MPKGVVEKVPKGKVVRRLQMSAGSPATATLKKPRSAFARLLDRYTGLKNLTPRKLQAIADTIGDTDNEESAKEIEHSGDEGWSDAGESEGVTSRVEHGDSEPGPSDAIRDSDHGDSDGDITPVDTDDDFFLGCRGKLLYIIVLVYSCRIR